MKSFSLRCTKNLKNTDLKEKEHKRQIIGKCLTIKFHIDPTIREWLTVNR